MRNLVLDAQAVPSDNGTLDKISRLFVLMPPGNTNGLIISGEREHSYPISLIRI